MRIGIDARFLTHPQSGGFKTYTRNLVAALAEVDAENQYFLYVDRPVDEALLPGRANVTFRIVPGALPLVGMPWREQIGLASRAVRDRLDLFHAPSLTAPLRLGCPLVVTIHDMIWLFPERFAHRTSASGKRKLMERYYRVVPRLAARRAAAVLTVSHAAKTTILEHLRLPADRVFVTYEAASPIYRRIDDPDAIAAMRRARGLDSEFILAIGSADPRKNLTTLLKAYAALPLSLRERYRLVVVWTHQRLAPSVSREADALGIADRLLFVEGVSDAELVALYNAAALFVFPSLYEGFGLPLLEAMACGTPVVAADNSSIPEIVDGVSLLVEATDSQMMADAIRRLLADATLRNAFIERGLVRASSFSWTKCARETLAVYQQVIAQHSRCKPFGQLDQA